MDIVQHNPRCLDTTSQSKSSTFLLQRFLDASLDRPRNLKESQNLLEVIRDLPPPLRRHACASRFVQESLLDNLALPWNTFFVLLTGFALVALMLSLRFALNTPNDLSIVIISCATFLLFIQLVYAAQASYFDELQYRFFCNPWRWIEILACGTAIAAAIALRSEYLSLIHI